MESSKGTDRVEGCESDLVAMAREASMEVEVEEEEEEGEEEEVDREEEEEDAPP